MCIVEDTRNNFCIIGVDYYANDSSLSLSFDMSPNYQQLGHTFKCYIKTPSFVPFFNLITRKYANLQSAMIVIKPCERLDYFERRAEETERPC